VLLSAIDFVFLSELFSSGGTMQLRPTLLPLLLLIAPFFTTGSSLIAQEPPQEQVALTPAAVYAGAPELVCLSAPNAASVEGDWLGRKLLFFPTKTRGWCSLAGVDVETPVGPSNLLISIHLKDGTTSSLTKTTPILAASYRTGSLTVAPGFVEPPADLLTRIKEEAALKTKIFAASASLPLWSGSFIEPVSAPPTDSFGTRRTFNGKLASVHKGMDFRTPTGTPVHAGNEGTVVIARPLYYEGNCVVIDHGLGLFSISMHLSRIDVQEGQHLRRGDLVGLSGATGRVTGPHLHWATRWQGAYLDPAKMLKLPLDNLR